MVFIRGSDERVNNIHDQVQNCGHKRDKQHTALHGGVVTGVHGVTRILADTGNGENDLRNDGTCQQNAQLGGQ